MLQGTSSGAGKSTLTIAFCRILSDLGYSVAPFKAQNMSSNLFYIDDSTVIASIQAIQALACRINPSVEMNPILLKPLGNYYSSVILGGKFFSKMHAKQYYEKFVLGRGFSIVVKSLKRLMDKHDIIVIEGAGSPAEINISRYDIANMILAKEFHIPVLLISDIERGGCFANILGTIYLLKRRERDLIKGIIINKFLGDIEILSPGISIIERKINKKIISVIPKINFNLPPEDSLDSFRCPTLNRKELEYNIDLLANEIKKHMNVKFLLKM